MSIFSALYNLFIGPLELFFEVVFSLANRVIQNPGLSIIFLSLAMNFLVLPLYKQADAMQAEERETENKLKHWVTHIKKTFKGDERFMMLQTYYRQNNYKPTDALKGSLSLLLEIPFFIAAYNFLSHLQLLQGVSFGPIKDLGAPDGLFVIAGVAINVLPILMTLINIISGIIYTKGFPLKSKIQLYGMALIFLVFLYKSPAGLVFYWTLNNIFSLFKNVFYKMKNPKFVLSVMSSITGAILLLATIFVHPMDTVRKQSFVIIILLLLQLPIIFHFIKKRFKTNSIVEITKKDNLTFFLGSIFITLVTGILIPSAVLKASPEEFINIVNFKNPLLYVLNSTLIAAGIFIVWFGIFYMLASPAGKKIMGLSMWGLSGIAIIDYMFFGKDYGNLSSKLKFDIYPQFSLKEQAINLGVLIIAIVILYFIWKKKDEIVRVVYFAAAIAVIGMSVVNVVGVQKAIAQTADKIEASTKDKPSIQLSKNEKNVVVIMMDRAINAYIPYLFNERPELKEQFKGFTYYPNTLSYGMCTNFGVPGFYGGYEYIPEEMNRRDKESLESKHNEALKVMPVIFDNNNFDVTVLDPSYAGYRWIPDLSIYDEYPNIRKFITKGRYELNPEDKVEVSEKSLNRNFFCYSIFKIAPTVLHPSLYSQGAYNEADVLYAKKVDKTTEQVRDGLFKAKGTRESFVDAYAVLKNLSNITEIKETKNKTFTMMSNDSTHDIAMLKVPEYEPVAEIDNTEYEATHKDRYTVNGRTLKMETENHYMHYQVNMASMLQLGKWLDYLRENGVYDNTKIIIAADHGFTLQQIDEYIAGTADIMAFNPLLLVKDFNSKEFKTDNTFMTNADVPTLATEGLIENPVNPFTKKPINGKQKEAPQQHVIFSYHWDITKNNGNVFMPGNWYAVKNKNILDKNNWEQLTNDKDK